MNNNDIVYFKPYYQRYKYLIAIFPPHIESLRNVLNEVLRNKFNIQAIWNIDPEIGRYPSGDFILTSVDHYNRVLWKISGRLDFSLVTKQFILDLGFICRGYHYNETDEHDITVRDLKGKLIRRKVFFLE